MLAQAGVLPNNKVLPGCGLDACQEAGQIDDVHGRPQR